MPSIIRPSRRDDAPALAAGVTTRPPWRRC